MSGGAANVARPAPIERTPSAFVDRGSQPTDEAVAAVLGTSAGLWSALRAAVAEAYPPIDEGWSYSGRKHGWSLRLRRRDRAIVYLTPFASGFRASLAIPERAIPTVLATDLPPDVLAIVAGAPLSAEGRAVRIEVRSNADLAGVVALARIRMAS